MKFIIILISILTLCKAQTGQIFMDSSHRPIYDIKAFSSGYPTPDGSTWDHEDYIRTIGDINGDRDYDIIGFGRAGVYVMFSCRSRRFEEPYFWSTYFGMSDGYLSAQEFPRFAADVNHDGYTDLIAFSKTDVMVLINNNGKPSTPVSFSQNPIILQTGKTMDQAPRIIKDANNDGYPDIIIFANVTYLAPGNGTGFATPYVWSTEFGTADNYVSFDTNPRLLWDFNRDGRLDIIGFQQDGTYGAENAYNEATLRAKSRIVAEFGNDQGWTSYKKYPRVAEDYWIFGFKNGGAMMSSASSAPYPFFNSIHDELSYTNESADWADFYVAPRIYATPNKYAVNFLAFSSKGDGIKYYRSNIPDRSYRYCPFCKQTCSICDNDPDYEQTIDECTCDALTLPFEGACKIKYTSGQFQADYTHIWNYNSGNCDAMRLFFISEINQGVDSEAYGYWNFTLENGIEETFPGLKADLEKLTIGNYVEVDIRLNMNRSSTYRFYVYTEIDTGILSSSFLYTYNRNASYWPVPSLGEPVLSISREDRLAYKYPLSKRGCYSYLIYNWTQSDGPIININKWYSSEETLHISNCTLRAATSYKFWVTITSSNFGTSPSIEYSLTLNTKALNSIVVTAEPYDLFSFVTVIKGVLQDANCYTFTWICTMNGAPCSDPYNIYSTTGPFIDIPIEYIVQGATYVFTATAVDSSESALTSGSLTKSSFATGKNLEADSSIFTDDQGLIISSLNPSVPATIQTLKNVTTDLNSAQLKITEMRKNTTSCTGCNGGLTKCTYGICLCYYNFFLVDCTLKDQVVSPYFEINKDLIDKLSANLKASYANVDISSPVISDAINTVKRLSDNSFFTSEDNLKDFATFLEKDIGILSPNKILNYNQTSDVLKYLSNSITFVSNNDRACEYSYCQNFENQTYDYLTKLSNDLLFNRTPNYLPVTLSTPIFDVAVVRMNLILSQVTSFQVSENSPLVEFQLKENFVNNRILSEEFSVYDPVDIYFYFFPNRSTLFPNTSINPEPADYVNKVLPKPIIMAKVQLPGGSEKEINFTNYLDIKVKMPQGISCPEGTTRDAKGKCICSLDLFDVRNQLYIIFRSSALKYIISPETLVNWNFYESSMFWVNAGFMGAYGGSAAVIGGSSAILNFCVATKLDGVLGISAGKALFVMLLVILILIPNN